MCLKNPEVRILTSYEGSQNEDFWLKFPFRQVPESIHSPIAVNELVKLVNETTSFTVTQKKRAESCVNFLMNGAPAHQLVELPSVFTKNSHSALIHGALVTDKLASWIKDDIVSGPFSSPPLSNFRVNPLIAVEQHDKVRPVLNVSEPAGRSFNDNVNKFLTEKVCMSSAKEFGYAIVKCGKNAKISKFDLVNAYKNIPTKLKDLRLQGFQWLGKYFVETQQIFGAKTSVCNFDIFGHTVLDLALARCDIVKSLVFRRLDDIPVVSPFHTSWCEDFSVTYKDVCNKLNVKLAPDCPNNEKAFSNQTQGRVLGIDFDTSDLTWSYPEEKRVKCLQTIEDVLRKRLVNLLDMQKLMGSLGDLGQLCPFLKGFKKPLNDMLSFLQNNPSEKCCVSERAEDDLYVWAGMLSDTSFKLPIPHEPCHSPAYCKEFVSDAAGNPSGLPGSGAGVGGVGFDEEGVVILAFQHIWSENLVCVLEDEKGVRFGHKTTTLEMLGLLIPFLLIPERLLNQHLVFKVDNLSCIFGWENRSVKGDVSASIIVRTILIISAYLSSHVHVEHLPRVATWEAEAVDRLSRLKTTTENDRRLLKSFGSLTIPSVLMNWLENPTDDWKLPEKLLSYVKDKVE